MIADGADASSGPLAPGITYNSTTVYGVVELPTPMRTNPTGEVTDVSNGMVFIRNNSNDAIDDVALSVSNPQRIEFYNQTDISSGTAGHAGFFRFNSADSKVAVTAEL